MLRQFWYHRNRNHTNIYLVIHQHSRDPCRIIEDQIDIFPETMLQAIHKWFCIQVRNRAHPYFFVQLL